MSTIGGLATYEGLEQNTETGEAVCNGIPTGWFFELPKARKRAASASR